MRSNLKFLLVDIDHVLCASWGRDSLIGGEGGWDAYHAAADRDEPLNHTIDLIDALHQGGYTIIGLTTRPAKWRQLTMTWLLKHGVYLDELLMRPDDDYDPAPTSKVRLALQRFNDQAGLRTSVAFVFDDRDDVIAAFQAEGISALQVFGRRG